ncbi:uncharacterized protein ATNIH1004_001697 [Aspergillus tanneri]|uniref:MADS-box domain-containing protein n=1 Tax=Aspergillus tanneri TaxID=1220188 RepID=A0A5M9N0C8_9EURO|nr:uncharacterized protein ATNIH1004_001697 [Aspergillus tanneri]KAA8652792.1 hypothetical protein ATNIH1004_001697 [Aspergillus tanneri]
MTSKRERDQERRRTKNSRERLKRRKERTIQNFHDYALLSGAKVYMLIQERSGEVTEYRNTSDKKFPPSYTQIRRLFPSARLLTPESFGTTTLVDQASTNARQRPGREDDFTGLQFDPLATDSLLANDWLVTNGCFGDSQQLCLPVQTESTHDHAGTNVEQCLEHSTF